MEFSGESPKHVCAPHATCVYSCKHDTTMIRRYDKHGFTPHQGCLYLSLLCVPTCQLVRLRSFKELHVFAQCAESKFCGSCVFRVVSLLFPFIFLLLSATCLPAAPAR
jgi:hypothetical protein